MNNQQNFNRPPPQPDYNQGFYNKNQTSVVTVGEWMVIILLMLIPLVNIIMLFVWAFSGGPKVSRANWAKATLLWFLIMLIFYVCIIVR